LFTCVFTNTKQSLFLDITGCSDAINGNLAALDATVSQISPIFTTLEEDATINPSSLILASFFSCFEGVSSSQRLNAETLTIGTWHRVNLPPSDLLCLFEIQQNALVWVINEGGGQFKIEIPLTHVTSIECLSLKNEPISDVHVYLSQSPLFYLDTPTEYGRQWIQCSDFTEDKQASRYLVHTLRGSPELAQDLSSLVYKKELQNIIHFIDPQHDALQIMSPVSTSILPSQHQYSTMTDSSAKYYIDTYPLLN
jgi:hypothetical protein